MFAERTSDHVPQNWLINGTVAAWVAAITKKWYANSYFFFVVVVVEVLVVVVAVAIPSIWMWKNNLLANKHIFKTVKREKKYTRIMLAFNSPNCRDINDSYTHLNHNSIQFELVFIPMQCFMFSIRFLFFHVSLYICVVVVLRMCIYVVFFYSV